MQSSSPDSSPQTIIVVDEVRTSSPEFFGIFSGWQWEFLRGKIMRAGISLSSLRVRLLKDAGDFDPSCLIVGMGEATLHYFTGKRGIDKWHLSPLKTKQGQKFIATFDMGRVQKQMELGLYQELAFCRAVEMLNPNWPKFPERFLLNPSLEDTIAVLERIRSEAEIAVDVETGRGQINTVGFAWSPHDAIAINVLPERFSTSSYYLLWDKIRAVLEGSSRKIFQNFIYDVSYFSAYGIRVANLTHDTMHAMKFLWPELDMNLGNVGRIYTKRPYWKDDGKVEHEEGKKKDWGDVRDWNKHYIYNCRDTTGTYDASITQRLDLNARGLSAPFNSYLMRLTEPVLEMCSNGMPVCPSTREGLKVDVERKIKELTEAFQREAGEGLNPRSSKQVQTFLRAVGVKLPKKFDKSTSNYRDSVDATAVKKIRLKHPEIKALEYLQQVKTLDKALSSYINFEPRPDGKLSYSLNITGTETLRFSGGKDPWGRGFNIQTIPREGGEVSIKSMFVAPAGRSFLEVDLRQAESRFVAYDAADATLIDMLESGEDVHRYVAAEIFKKSTKDVTKDERQLGKKAGHGANYAMKAGVFSETCFSEMDLVLGRKEAEGVLEAYHRLFPGIRRWHAQIRGELNLKRKLKAPSGWERYFYGRFGDDMFKEAYAWRPQHTIPWITNHLMLGLCAERKSGRLKFNLIVQVHDSLILLVEDGSLGDVARFCLDFRKWHPEVTLAGGQMWIPTEVKVGGRMSELKEWEG